MLQEVTRIHQAVLVPVLGEADTVLAGPHIGEEDRLVPVHDETADHLAALLVEQVHDVAVLDIRHLEGNGTQLLVLGQGHLHLRTVIVVPVHIPELPVGNLQEIVETGHQFLLRHDRVPAQVVRIPRHLVGFDLLLLTRVHGPENQRIPGVLDERILELHRESVLFHGRRVHLALEYRDGILVLDVALGTLLQFCPELLVQGKLHFLVRGNEVPEGIRLVIVDLQEQGVRHPPLVIHPQFQAVLLRIDLGDELFSGETLEFQRVDLDIRRHEGQE